MGEDTRIDMEPSMAEECAGRRARATAAAAERGLGALLVWSRGGHARDRYADVYYLAHHYMAFSHVVDNPPHWASTGHCALVLPTDGEPALLLPAANWRPDQVTVADVRVGADLPRLVGDTLREKGVAHRPVGLVGADAMTLLSYQNLLRVLPGLALTPADDILRGLRLVKSPRELAAVRRSGALGSRAVEAIMRAAVPGATEAAAAAGATAEIVAAGGALYGFAFGSGPHSPLFSATPLTGYDAARPLRAGDLLHIDSVTALDGYYCDVGRSGVVGGVATSAQRDLLEIAMGGVQAVIAAIRPGMTAREASAAGDRYIAESGALARGYTEMADHWGHSIGLTWEAPWLMQDDETPLQEGMVLAIEEGLSHPDVGFVCYEDDLIVTATRAEVITTTPRMWWD